jgi:hypothetical protein
MESSCAVYNEARAKVIYSMEVDLPFRAAVVLNESVWTGGCAKKKVWARIKRNRKRTGLHSNKFQKLAAEADLRRVDLLAQKEALV